MAFSVLLRLRSLMILVGIASSRPQTIRVFLALFVLLILCVWRVDETVLYLLLLRADKLPILQEELRASTIHCITVFLTYLTPHLVKLDLLWIPLLVTTKDWCVRDNRNALVLLSKVRLAEIVPILSWAWVYAVLVPTYGCSRDIIDRRLLACDNLTSSRLLLLAIGCQRLLRHTRLLLCTVLDVSLTVLLLSRDLIPLQHRVVLLLSLCVVPASSTLNGTFLLASLTWLLHIARNLIQLVRLELEDVFLCDAWLETLPFFQTVKLVFMLNYRVTLSHDTCFNLAINHRFHA